MHTIYKRIYYHDTDCGGVIYYANYLKFLEEARTELFRENGISLKELASRNIWLAVKSVSVEYKSPGRYADMLAINSMMVKLKPVTIQFAQEVKRETKLLLSATTVLVCINEDFRPIPVPECIHDAFRR